MIKVLIVEDDLLIADMVESRLERDGFTVCGIATDIAGAIALATEHHPAVAVIDVRLNNGDLGTKLGIALKQIDQIAVLYATGNTDLVIKDDSVVGEACLRKPYLLKNLSACISVVQRLVRDGSAEPPYPEGLIILAPYDSAPSIA